MTSSIFPSLDSPAPTSNVVEQITGLSAEPLSKFFNPVPMRRAMAPNLIIDSGPPASWLGLPTPVPAKPGPMPADDSFRLHNKYNVRPSRPYLPQARPEEAVQAVKCRSRPFAVQHGELLPQSQKSMRASPEEYADGRQKCEDQVGHE